jgi:Na+/phosphate symporter
LAAAARGSLAGGRPTAVTATLAAAAAWSAAHLGHELLTFFGAGVLHGFAHFLAIRIRHGGAPALATTSALAGADAAASTTAGSSVT